MTALILDGPEMARCCLLLAHGAGQPSTSPFMATMASELAGNGIFVARFDFPYMARAQREGRRRPPDRPAILVESFGQALWEVRAHWKPDNPERARLAIGGKSMGGRIASQIAGNVAADALVCLGYPFHPPGKAVGDRLTSLQTVAVPTLILQGERDSFGNREEVPGYALPAPVTVSWVRDGDHSFKPRKASGRTEVDNLKEAAMQAASFLQAL